MTCREALGCNFWGPPLKFGTAKTSEIRRDFGQLQTLIANISGQDEDIENQKSK